MRALQVVVTQLLFVLALGGCGQSAMPAPSPPSSDLVALGRLIELPDSVESAEWATREMPGGNDWELVARLIVPTSMTEDLMATATPVSYTRGGGLADFQWLGDDAYFDDTVKCYEATPFFKGGLRQGRVLVLRDGVILLVLYTM